MNANTPPVPSDGTLTWLNARLNDLSARFEDDCADRQLLAEDACEVLSVIASALELARHRQGNGRVLTPADLTTVLSALADADEYRTKLAVAYCGDCAAVGGFCADCDSDVQLAVQYAALAQELGR